MLRAYWKKLFDDAVAVAADGGPDDQKLVGTFNGPITLHYEKPYYGKVNGNDVTIVGEASMIGFSPVSKCIDTASETAWIPDEFILLDDPRLDPRLRPGGVNLIASTK